MFIVRLVTGTQTSRSGRGEQEQFMWRIKKHAGITAVIDGCFY